MKVRVPKGPSTPIERKDNYYLIICAGARATSSGKLADSENPEKTTTFLFIYSNVKSYLIDS